MNARTGTKNECDGALRAVPLHWRRRSESGMTLLITMGFLAILLMLIIAMAITARTEKKISTATADMVRARMMAESALSRAIATIEQDLAGSLFPADAMYKATSGPWAGRPHMVSTGNDSAAVGNALGLAVNGLTLAPASGLNPSAGWMPVTATRNIDGTDQEVVIGRQAFLVIDETGKIDPSAVVCPDETEGSETIVRTGASVAEISLAHAGIPDPNRFRPNVVTNGPAGLMPAGNRWFSMAHIVRALQPGQNHLDTFLQKLHPFSYDSETFWRDKNNNGVWDPGEDEERIDLNSPLTLAQLYEAFVGPDKASGDDDCAWLKQTDHRPWVQQWRTTLGISTVRARQIIAAQIAANIIDYIDDDSIPTAAHVDAGGNIVEGTTDEPGTYNVTGVERTWGISEVAMKLTTKVVLQDPPLEITGDLNINPGNSWSEFVLHTPSGTITRDTLHAEGAGFNYQGPASKVELKVIAVGKGGTSLVINGHVVNLPPQHFYTITGNPMSVNLRNLNPQALTWPKAMGHWWIHINADNATIDPDPGIPELEPWPVALEITPGFKAEAFYPFMPNAGSDDPPGTLSVSYFVQVITATGQTGIAEGSLDVPLDHYTNEDGGTLAYSLAYAEASMVNLADPEPFDMTQEPPRNWYTVSLAQITAVTLKDAAGNVINNVPTAAGGEYDHYLCNWSQAGTSTETATFYASVRAKDALHNSQGKVHPDFAEFWTAYPDASTLGSVDQSDMGNLNGTAGYLSAAFCQSQVKNAPFERLGELGRVHSYQPTRSLRLWAPDTAGEVGHDAEILDLFKLGTSPQSYGRININTRDADVLNALFRGATTVPASTAAAAILARRNQGVTFTSPGQVFGGVAGVSGSDPANDAIEEEAIGKLAELVTARQNYFTVVACAQTVQDTPSGPQVQGEQKILAVLYRDAFSGQTKIERFEYLSD